MAQPSDGAYCRSPCSRTWRSDRSIVDALMASTAARISGPSLRCPCRSIASTNVGISAFRRLPQIRSDASHKNDYRLADRLVVDPPTGLRRRAARGGVAPQQPHHVLSVKAGDCNEFIENACLLGAPGNCVPSCQGVNQFVSCRHAYLPHSNAPSAIFLGSISNEATHRARGAFQVRQCEHSTWKRGRRRARHTSVRTPSPIHLA